jgi:hypothetical protein
MLFRITTHLNSQLVGFLCVPWGRKHRSIPEVYYGNKEKQSGRLFHRWVVQESRGIGYPMGRVDLNKEVHFIFVLSIQISMPFPGRFWIFMLFSRKGGRLICTCFTLHRVGGISSTLGLYVRYPLTSRLTFYSDNKAKVICRQDFLFTCSLIYSRPCDSLKGKRGSDVKALKLCFSSCHTHIFV